MILHLRKKSRMVSETWRQKKNLIFSLEVEGFN